MNFHVTISRADGAELEVSGRTEVGGLGTLSEEVEIALTELSHGDMNLELADVDGEIESFLSGIDPSDEVTVLVEREIEDSRRQKWQTVFEGTLDLPWSVSFNRKTKIVRFQAFSLTKVLERLSAEGLIRSFPSIGAGTVTLGTTSVTLNSTAGISSGDDLELDDGLNLSETQVVDLVLSSTVLRTVSPWTNSFTGGTANIRSPYLRWKSPASLASSLVGLSSFSPGTFVFTKPLFPIPFVSPVNVDGLPEIACRSLLEVASGTLETSFSSSDVTIRGHYRTSGPQDAWTQFDTTTPCRGDWRPYLTTRPTNFPTLSTVSLDMGVVAWDHTNNRTYQAGVQAPGLILLQNAVNIATLNASGGGVSYPLIKIEYDPINDKVWTSYRTSDASRNVVEVYTVAGGAQTDVPGSSAGQLRMVRDLGVMLWLSEDGTTLKIYDPTSLAVTRTISNPSVVPVSLYLWSIRYYNGFILGGYNFLSRLRLRIWDSDWNIVADYDIAPNAPTLGLGTPLVTVFDHSTLGRVALIANSVYPQTYGVLSTLYAGVIPYADLTGMSVASGLRELALLSLSVVRVDNRLVSFVRRDDATDPVLTIEDPLEDVELPVWENYRTTVKVAGRDVSETVGSSPAKQLEISSDFITTGSLAVLLANVNRAFLSTVRRQREILIREEGVLVRPLETIRLDDADWIVLRAETDLKERSQDLTIVESLT